MSELRRLILMSAGKTGKCPPTGSLQKDYSPVSWSKYFDNEYKIHINDDQFHVYTLGIEGPVLLLLHGGGYSALTWALFTEEIRNRIECRILAIDLRGHGSTLTFNEDDLSLDSLAKDIANIIETIYKDQVPPIVMIGHSLGGAIAVEVALRVPYVIGLCVIDVVEGTALESLSSMQSILRSRPSSFNTVEQAIQWSIRSGQTRNIEAARVSMPGQIINLKTNELATNENVNLVQNHDLLEHTHKHLNHFSHDAVIEEENCDDTNNSIQNHYGHDYNNQPNGEIKASTNSSSDNLENFKNPKDITKYIWRIDLSKTEPFWNGWFKGLSQKFLDIHIPKVLLLAHIHGLDTTLTVGLMQGKFQLQVLPRSGHAIQEDQPHHVADIIAGFLIKQKLAIGKNNFTPIMPTC